VCLQRLFCFDVPNIVWLSHDQSMYSEILAGGWSNLTYVEISRAGGRFQ